MFIYDRVTIQSTNETNTSSKSIKRQFLCKTIRKYNKIESLIITIIIIIQFPFPNHQVQSLSPTVKLKTDVTGQLITHLRGEARNRGFETNRNRERRGGGGEIATRNSELVSPIPDVISSVVVNGPSRRLNKDAIN